MHLLRTLMPDRYTDSCVQALTQCIDSKLYSLTGAQALMVPLPASKELAEMSAEDQIFRLMHKCTVQSRSFDWTVRDAVFWRSRQVLYTDTLGMLIDQYMQPLL